MNEKKIEKVSITYVLNELLNKGKIKINEHIFNIKTSYLNTFLNPLNYKAIKWNDTKEIYLVNCPDNIEECEEKWLVIPPWSESKTRNAKINLEKLAKGEIHNNTDLDMLFKYGYIEKKNNKIILSPRSLLNYGSYFKELNEQRFHNCKVCNNIVDGSNIHKSCKKILLNK